MMDALVEIKGFYGYASSGRMLFNDAGLAMYGGEKVLLSAPVGSGKNMVVKMIAGLSKPVRGEVYVFGKDVYSIKRSALDRLRKKIGFVFHDNILISNLKVIENVALPMLYHSDMSYDESMEKAVRLLGKSGFRGDMWVLPGILPLYYRKAVAVARAISLEPDVAIFENLSYGLTASEFGHLSKVINEYHASGPGRLVVFTSANENDAAGISPQRIIRITGGKFVEQPAS